MATAQTLAQQPTPLEGGDAAAALAAAAAAQATADAAAAGLAAIDTGIEIAALIDAVSDANLLTDAERAKLAAIAGNWKNFYTDGSGNIQALALGAAGRVLTSNGAAAAPTFETPAAVGGWTTVFKTSDETRNSSTTLADDAALVVALEATKSYVIRVFAIFNTDATPDIKYGLAYSSTLGATITSIRRTMAGGESSGVSTEVHGVGTTLPSGTTLTNATGGRGSIQLEAVVTTTGAGNFSFQWAQNTSDAANTTVLLGSRLEWREVV